MNKFQNVSFKSISDFLSYLPEEELFIVERLRELIFDCIPDAKEKLSYNVPFYYRFSRICFIWPGSVPWGNIKSGVLLGFCKGHLLSDISCLEVGERKEVYTKTFHNLKEINTHVIRQLLHEAAVVDEEARLKKKMRR
ncbi:MAG: DUF1801 domain-containing protein [Flavisolibacter sp.]|nr:DUF1801 domain-containing protein [Flavisolibacter sp.]